MRSSAAVVRGSAPVPGRSSKKSAKGSAKASGKVRSQRGVQSMEVGGRLLLALAARPGPSALTALAAEAGLTPARAHPYLVSFGRLGLIEQDAASGRYALGPAALQMGLACLHQADPITTATRAAEALAQRVDQPVAVAVWANFGPTIVRLFESSQPLHISMRPGSVMSVLGTATGRAFAAALPDAALASAWHAAGGARRADGSPAKDIDGELKSLRREFARHGVTRAVGRPIPGVNAFSAPVFDAQGSAVAVVTVLGHEDTFPSAWDSAFAAAVRDAAADASRRLGYHPA